MLALPLPQIPYYQMFTSAPISTFLKTKNLIEMENGIVTSITLPVLPSYSL